MRAGFNRTLEVWKPWSMLTLVQQMSSFNRTLEVWKQIFLLQASLKAIRFNRTLEVWKPSNEVEPVTVKRSFNRTLEVWKLSSATTGWPRKIWFQTNVRGIETVVVLSLLFLHFRFQSNLRGMETLLRRFFPRTILGFNRTLEVWKQPWGCP